MNTREIIIKKLQNLTKVKFNEDSLLEDLKIDSLDLAELIIEAEQAFEISIDDNKLNDVKTVKDVILLIENSN
ncbi:phosphopantetheine-binding protein [Mycoplasmopsis gallinacea]|uniref:Acyl carrier protein (ACP) n=1 Tax=Mycoplasmopsis gallinacea TaxID=29556 RepID=A0A449A3J5_9BACT|nr:phosphopantetheine-binding protein [Mycoplasmopsis gallinacea]VEU58774.1 acyl carrier protein (ACP) [Mycoplasmopsis gallinacea]